MASFKKTAETDLLVDRYKDRIIVYVESDEDFHIFARCWFFEEMERLEFRSSDQVEGGGCTQVIGLVEKDRNDGIIAFGLVDRDALMRCAKWDVFWERDDEKFSLQRTLGDFITILCRWEIENYLLDPVELEKIFADNPKKGLREPRSKELVIKEFLQYGESLIPVMAANVLFHAKGIRALHRDFGFDIEERTEIEEKVKDTILKENLPDSSLKSYQNYMERFESFAENHPPGSDKRWERLNRMIDGKALWNRLQRKHGLQDDRRFEIARRIKENNKIDKEISSHIKYFKHIK